jgi:hypothetical protein
MCKVVVICVCICLAVFAIVLGGSEPVQAREVVFIFVEDPDCSSGWRTIINAYEDGELVYSTTHCSQFA